MMNWLNSQGHFVAAATKHPVDIRYRPYKLQDGKEVPIICGTNIDMVNDTMDKWKMDVCISLFDVWILKKPLKRHIPWIPIDTENVSQKIIDTVKDCPMQIALSGHGWAELCRYELTPHYAPIGYDPDVFCPKPKRAKEFRKSLVFPDSTLPAEEMFLIGSVGVNYPDDRKGFVLLLRAFQTFHKRHPNARLYIHTQGKQTTGVDYARVALELGIFGLVAWPDQDMFWYGLYSEEIISEMYSGFDVFCLPTRGEGFGMPVVEAQACGTPVIVTDNTTGPELCKTGWLIETDDDDPVYTGSNTWRVQPKPSAIVAALEKAFNQKPEVAFRHDNTEFNPALCSHQIQDYSWPKVWGNYWQPILDEIESMLPLEGE
jgi:glycosyltransferase involved in cell wall biosynthesis